MVFTGVMDGRRIIEVNGVDLCVDTAGDAADPAMLLIGGMGSSMDWSKEEFCQRRRRAAGLSSATTIVTPGGQSATQPGPRGTPARTWPPTRPGCWTRSGGGARAWPGYGWAAPSLSRLRWLIRAASTR